MHSLIILQLEPTSESFSSETVASCILMTCSWLLSVSFCTAVNTHRSQSNLLMNILCLHATLPMLSADWRVSRCQSTSDMACWHKSNNLVPWLLLLLLVYNWWSSIFYILWDDLRMCYARPSMSLCVKVAIHTTGPVTAAFFNKPSDALYQTVVTYTVAVASILCCCF